MFWDLGGPPYLKQSKLSVVTDIFFDLLSFCGGGLWGCENSVLGEPPISPKKISRHQDAFTSQARAGCAGRSAKRVGAPVLRTPRSCDC
eukprot:622301-Amphidinium_carterae.1